jgi:hypothetical protein
MMGAGRLGLESGTSSLGLRIGIERAEGEMNGDFNA